MRLAWKFRNTILWLATAGLGMSACIGVPSLTKWLQNSDDLLDNSAPVKVPSKTKTKKGALDPPTEEQLAQACSVNLQRMNPPKALPPPEKPAIVAEPTPPVSVDLFQGKLVGTIVDSDPKYCFALFRGKGTDNGVKLVAQGQKIDNQSNSATVVTVLATAVTIKLGERQQTLKVVEEP